jgi:PTS system galactitol-specific IIA component
MVEKLTITPALVQVRVCAADSEEAIRGLASLLRIHGFVEEGFEESVVAREEIYPTGLPLPIGVAIPHTDAEHVKRGALAIAVLEEPVTFGEMGSVDATVKVSIVCMMAIKNVDAVVHVLRQLIETFQEIETLKALQRATSTEEVVLLLQAKIPDFVSTDQDHIYKDQVAQKVIS